MSKIKVIKTIRIKKPKYNQTISFFKKNDEFLKNEVLIRSYLIRIPLWESFLYTFCKIDNIQITGNELEEDKISNFKVVEYKNKRVKPLIDKIILISGKNQMFTMLQSFEKSLYYLHILHTNNIIHNNINLQTILLDADNFIFISDFSLSFYNHNHNHNHITNSSTFSHFSHLEQGSMPIYFKEIWKLNKDKSFHSTNLEDILLKTEEYIKETNILTDQECHHCITKHRLFLTPFISQSKEQIINIIINLLFSWDLSSLALSFLYLYRNYFQSFCVNSNSHMEELLLQIIYSPWDKSVLETLTSFKQIYLSLDSSTWKTIIKQHM